MKYQKDKMSGKSQSERDENQPYQATDFVETAGGRAANDSLHDARTRLKVSSQ